LSSNL